MRTCPKCGTTANAKFCPDCGNPMSPEGSGPIGSQEAPMFTPKEEPSQRNYSQQNQQPQPNRPVYYDKPKKPFYKRWWFITIIVIFVLGGIGSALGGDDTSTDTTDTGKSQSTKETKDKVMKIDPGELLTLYEENEVKGDEVYKDKEMQLTGTIDSIGKDLAEDVYITFKTGEEFSITSVQCYFSDDAEIKKVMDLKSGQKITVIGRCDGKFSNVFIKDCVIK